MSNEEYDIYDIELEGYAEEMFERRANGMGVMSFEDWKRRKEYLRSLLESIEAKRDQ